MELFSEDRIGELEEKVENLIKNYKLVKEEHEKLLANMKPLEMENKELKEKMAEMKKDKDIVIGKVTKLLEKIQKVEE
jgi:regulator of replication initiation timing